MESWRRVWREGVVPLLSVVHLEALEKALREDDPALIQGATCSPPPLQCVMDWPAEMACLLAYPGWKCGCKTVAEVEDFFALLCEAVDRRLGEPSGVRWLMNWYDETLRVDMIRDLLPEVERALEHKRTTEPGLTALTHSP